MPFQRIDTVELNGVKYHREYFGDAIVITDSDNNTILKVELGFLHADNVPGIAEVVRSMLELTLIDLWQELSSNKSFMSRIQ
jgi:hypothetical protein